LSERDKKKSENSTGAHLLNYKGIYEEDDEITENKYTCPMTGAHFNFIDMCRRLKLVVSRRLKYERKIAELFLSGKSNTFKTLKFEL
jgi:hypothetical protein